jgi:putative flavoprotein involved in K+ transport
MQRDVVVIGAGQAGLAIGYFLARQGSNFTILDAGDNPASAWRARWDSLRLFTPARYSSLPGLPFPGDPDHYPSRAEVANYLTEYARHFDLPVVLGSRVKGVTKSSGTYRVELDGACYETDQVVIAIGAFQAPVVPGIADDLDQETFQVHSSEYRTPKGLPSGIVLVVGGGNTGFQIADELSASHEVHLSIGSKQPSLPQRVLGRDLFWYLEKTGLISKTAESSIGRRLRDRDTLIGSSLRNMRRRGVHIRGRTVAVSGRTATFSDGTQLNPDVVIWATGYRPDHSWIRVPVFDHDGTLLHRRGVTESPGLYFLGLPWMHTRGSALLGWVKDDAEYIAHKISALPGRPATAAEPSGAPGVNPHSTTTAALNGSSRVHARPPKGTSP